MYLLLGHILPIEQGTDIRVSHLDRIRGQANELRFVRPQRYRPGLVLGLSGNGQHVSIYRQLSLTAYYIIDWVLVIAT